MLPWRSNSKEQCLMGIPSMEECEVTKLSRMTDIRRDYGYPQINFKLIE
jgi:hypothetical protein